MAGSPRHARPVAGAVSLSRYVGIPFLDGGRDRAGCDCWGLVRLVLRERAGIEVPTYGEISAADLVRVTDTIRTEADRGPWLEVGCDQVRAFDVCLLRGRPLHVGIMRDPLHVLHVEAKTAAVIVPLTHPSVSFRIIGFRRHRDLT